MSTGVATAPDSLPNLVLILLSRLAPSGLTSNGSTNADTGTDTDTSKRILLRLTWLLIPSILLYYGWALHTQNAQLSRKITRAEKLYWARIWQTASWPAFFAAAELYLVHHSAPWGPWDATSITDDWGDKRYLQRLLRWGILPLVIRPGGLTSYQVREAGFRTQGVEFQWPEYVHSRGRAYFQFLVPHPDGLGDVSEEAETRSKGAMGKLFRRKFMEELKGLKAEFEVAGSISILNGRMRGGSGSDGSFSRNLRC